MNKKRIKWEQIQKQYPNKWVIITDVVERNGNIKSCILLQVCNKNEKAQLISQYMRSEQEFRCERTTYNAPNVGILA